MYGWSVQLIHVGVNDQAQQSKMGGRISDYKRMQPLRQFFIATCTYMYLHVYSYHVIILLCTPAISKRSIGIWYAPPPYLLRYLPLSDPY